MVVRATTRPISLIAEFSMIAFRSFLFFVSILAGAQCVVVFSTIVKGD